MNVIPLRQPAADIVCPECGEAAGLSCIKCGWSARERATKAIAESPHKSNRLIARETGVSRATINRARIEGGSREPRIGIDGKTYPVTDRVRPQLSADDQVKFILALIKPHWNKLSKRRRRELLDILEDML